MSTDDVTIPADVAHSKATYLRYLADAAERGEPITLAGHEVTWLRRTADLLDPKPPTLREKAVLMLTAMGWDSVVAHDMVAALLPFLADEAGPLWGHDVAAWLRGGP